MTYRYFRHFLLFLIYIFAATTTYSSSTGIQENKTFVVVIDPGHGGKDPGAVNKSIREKDVVLAIGLKLGALIRENHQDVKVVYTRNTDVFVPLIDRSKIANKNKADLLISIHANYCGTPATRGTETFVLGLHRSNENLEVAKKENSVILLEEDYSTTYEGFDPNSPESYIMFELVQDLYMDQSLVVANHVQQQFSSRIKSPNRGVKQAGFLVLRQSSMPSILIEAGFLSNQTEANYLNSQTGQYEIAYAVSEAFKKFRNKSSNSNTHQEPDLTANDVKTEQANQKPELKTVEEKTSQKPGQQPDSNQMAVKKQEINSKKETPENKPDIKQAANSEPTKPYEEKSLAQNIYYSIQIGANTSPVEPVASNFKGLKNVRREKLDKYYRYYIGKESTLEKAGIMLTQIRLKYPQAFIVSYVNEKRIPLFEPK